MKPVHFAALSLLGAIWGASFLFIGIAVDEFGPPTLMFIRVLLAAVILGILAYIRQQKHGQGAGLRLQANWRKYLTVGLLNCALPFTLIAFSELRLTASVAAILISTTPLFTALVSAARGNEKLTGRKGLGLLLGVTGVAALMETGPLDMDLGLILAVLASLLAAFCYGAATVYASRNISRLPAVYASIGQFLGAAVILALPAALTIPPARPSSTAILALLALTVLSTSFAYLLYFFLLRNVGPTRTASVTYLVPVFGSLWGVVFLQEPFNSGMLLGLALVLASVGLITGVQSGNRNPAQAPSVSDAGDT